jgi:hypothetical protein
LIIETPGEYWNFAPDEAMLYAARKANPARLERSMNNVRHLKRGRSAVTVVLAVALLTVGCASQGGGDEAQAQKNRCPSGTTLRCFKRTPEPEQCSCVSRQKIEDLLE